MAVQLQGIQVLLPTLLLAAVWVATALDFHQRRIPNRLTVNAAILGIVLQSLIGGPSGLLAALGGLGVGLAILLPGYAVRTTGAGDVKLMAAAGTFLGPFWALVAGLASMVIGALVAVLFAASTIVSRTPKAPWQRYGLMLRTLVSTGRVSYIAPADGEVMGQRFPFAVSIALGTTATLALWWPSLAAQWAG